MLTILLLALLQPSSEAFFAAIGVRPGAHVCEIGAGDGRLTIAAAAAVGPSGRVFSSELGERRVAVLREKVAGAAENITVVAGADTRTNFAVGSCDAIFLRDVYHHFIAPAAMVESIAAALRPGGRVGVIDFTPPPGSKAPTPADRGKDGMHGIRPEDLTAEMRAAGFEVAESEIGSRWFMLVFRFAGAPPPDRSVSPVAPGHTARLFQPLQRAGTR